MSWAEIPTVGTRVVGGAGYEFHLLGVRIPGTLTFWSSVRRGPLSPPLPSTFFKRTNLENLSVADGMSVALGTPKCDLQWEGCRGDATRAFRIHGCAFYYACESCGAGMCGRIDANFARFNQLLCKRCGTEFNTGKYYEMIVL